MVHVWFALITNSVNGNPQVGVIPMDETKVVMKGRLGPGMMITVDLQTGQVRIETNNLFSFLPLTAAEFCTKDFKPHEPSRCLKTQK